MQKESDTPSLGLAHRKCSDSADCFHFRKFTVSVVLKTSNCKCNVLEIQMSKIKHSLKGQKPQRYELVCLLVHVKLDPCKISSDNKTTPLVK